MPQPRNSASTPLPLTPATRREVIPTHHQAAGMAVAAAWAEVAAWVAATAEWAAEAAVTAARDRVDLHRLAINAR